MNAKVKKVKKSRQVVKTGDVIAIPLPDGRYAFGLKMGENIAVYSVLSDRKDNPPIGHRKFLFVAGVYGDVTSSLDWPKVGKDLVSEKDIEFTSVGYIKDQMTGQYQFYSPFIDGYMRPAAKNECIGLECVAVYEKNHIEDRIIDTLLQKKSVWIQDDDWMPLGVDLSDEKNPRRVEIQELLA